MVSISTGSGEIIYDQRKRQWVRVENE